MRWKNNMFLWTPAFLVTFNTFFHILCKPNCKWHCLCSTCISFSSLDAHILDKLIALSFLNCVWTCTSWLHSTQCLHLVNKFIIIALLLFANYLNFVTNASIHPFISLINASFLEGEICFSKDLFHKILRKTLIKGT